MDHSSITVTNKLIGTARSWSDAGRALHAAKLLCAEWLPGVIDVDTLGTVPSDLPRKPPSQRPSDDSTNGMPSIENNAGPSLADGWPFGDLVTPTAMDMSMFDTNVGGMPNLEGDLFSMLRNDLTGYMDSLAGIS